MSRFQLLSSAIAVAAVYGLALSGCTSKLEIQSDVGGCDASQCGSSSSDASNNSNRVRTLSDGGTEYVDGGPGPACSDGIDNDGDGKTDLDDPDCLATFDDSESGEMSGDGDAGTADGTGGSNGNFSVSYRVNAGGAAVSADPDWEADNDANRSDYLSGAGQQFGAVSSSNPDLSVDGDVDEDVPSEIFEETRWDGSGESGGSGEMVYEFNVDAGTHRVHLYFCETWEGANEVGTRVFDVEINGNTVIDDLDMYEEAGGFTGFVKTVEVETSGDDENLAVRFLHESNNPMVAGLEVESSP